MFTGLVLVRSVPGVPDSVTCEELIATLAINDEQGAEGSVSGRLYAETRAVNIYIIGVRVYQRKRLIDKHFYFEYDSYPYAHHSQPTLRSLCCRDYLFSLSRTLYCGRHPPDGEGPP